MKSKQQLIVGVSGLVLNEEERLVLLHPKIHGVILFTRNYQNPQQLRELATSIHILGKQIYVDQEGGRVQRFRRDFTTLPALGSMPSNEIFAWAELMATELKLCGVDQSFAPIVDLNRGSQVIGDRAFAADTDTVIKSAEQYIAGMEKAGMMGVLKHFPGHGSVTPDTHHSVAIDKRTLTELEATDLKPFLYFAHQNVGMMISHVIYPEVDSKPASLSKFWITDYLRDKLKFTGPIFSDDLGMGAVAKGTPAPDLVQETFAAGADYALLCNDWAAVIATLQVIG